MRPPAAVTEPIKRERIAAYDGPAGVPASSVELDHLIPLELGGATSVRNLWPEPLAAAHRKDGLESRLHQLVCDGQVSLVEAQQAIATDWLAAYQRYAGAG